jgi:hypothetical protein
VLVLIAIFARSLPDSGVLEEEILKLLCFAGLEGSGFRFALEGLCCEKNHHKSKFLSSCQQQEFRCRNEVVSKQNPPQPQQDFSHLDETSLQQPSRKKWKIMQRLKRSGEGREHVAPIFVRRSDSKWSDSWQSQQVTTLQQLQLQDMALDDTYVVKATAEQAHETDVVLVDLDVQKTGWGFFVRGQVQSSIQQQCNRCFLKYLSPVRNYLSDLSINHSPPFGYI